MSTKSFVISKYYEIGKRKEVKLSILRRFIPRNRYRQIVVDINVSNAINRNFRQLILNGSTWFIYTDSTRWTCVASLYTSNIVFVNKLTLHSSTHLASPHIYVSICQF